MCVCGCGEEYLESYLTNLITCRIYTEIICFIFHHTLYLTFPLFKKYRVTISYVFMLILGRITNRIYFEIWLETLYFITLGSSHSMFTLLKKRIYCSAPALFTPFILFISCSLRFSDIVTIHDSNKLNLISTME